MREYAVVDIETTGGSVSYSRITEIAIICHNGTEVTQRWSSLINPEMLIPLHITALTGISEEMVAEAPTFADVAYEVHEILKGRTFVAHNVNFDYSFLRGQLAVCGFEWDAVKLCTVRLSRKLIPGLPSYSLGKLCAAVNIPLFDRHRAMGDATATVKLLELLLSRDDGADAVTMVKKSSPSQRLPPNVPLADFDALPNSPGVYYFYNKAGKIIYIGKAVNIKKRVASHFTGNNPTARRQYFLKDIFSIGFEPCGSELMALLLECAEIQQWWPMYNKALKRFEAKFGLYHYVAVNGYSHLAIGKLPKSHQCILTFDREIDGLNYLSKLIEQFKIDVRFCSFGAVKSPKNTDALPTLVEHNTAVEELLMAIENAKPTFVMQQPGRKTDELGLIYIEKGRFKGMGYVENDLAQALNFEDDVVKRYKTCHYMNQLVVNYAQLHPHCVKMIG